MPALLDKFHAARGEIVDPSKISDADRRAPLFGESLMTGGIAILTAVAIKNGDVAEAIISGAMTVSFAGITLRSMMNEIDRRDEVSIEDVQNAGQQE